MDAVVTLLNESGRWLVTQLGRMSVELAILAGIVLIALYVLRVKSPALRHLFWGLLLAKPVVTFLVASPLSLYAFLWPSMPTVFHAPAPASVRMERAPQENPMQTVSAPEAPPSVEPPRPTAPPFSRRIDRYGLTSAVWILAASVLGLRLLLGCAYVAFLCSTALTHRDGLLADLVDEAKGPLRMRRRVRIATTRVMHGPVLAGIFRPVILLPAVMAGALTPKQLKLVITHELAHARRWDNLVLLIQRLAEMFFFFHPVVWVCGWMMRREAEAACDDVVVSAYGDGDGAGATAYVDSLTCVAEMRCGITRRLLVNTFAAAESNFNRRIRRILNGRRARMTLWLSMATGAVLILIGAVGLPTASSSPVQSAMPIVSDYEQMIATAKGAGNGQDAPYFLVQPASGSKLVAVPIEGKTTDNARKAAVYDRKAIVHDYNSLQQAYKKLQSYSKTQQIEIDKKQADLVKQKRDFDAVRASLSPQESAASKRKIDALYEAYRADIKRRQADIDDKERAFLKPILEEVEGVAKSVAEAKGYMSVRDIHEKRGGPAAEAGADITNDIRAKLGDKVKPHGLTPSPDSAGTTTVKTDGVPHKVDATSQSPSAPAASTSGFPERKVQFPKDSSIGRVGLMDAGDYDAYGGQWDFNGKNAMEAQGEITIPAGKVWALQINAAVANDPESLDKLAPDQLAVLCIDLSPQEGNNGNTKSVAYPEDRAIRADFFGRLSRFRDLQSLHLSYVDIDKTDLGSLASMQRLTDLRVACDTLSDSGAARIGGLKQLQRLKIYARHGLSKAALENIGKLEDLRRLLLTSATIDNAGLAALTRLDRLEKLSMCGCGSLTQEGYAHIARIAPLKILDLTNINTTPEQLAALAKHPTLEQLTVRRVSDAHLKALAALRSLKKLAIDKDNNDTRPYITEAGFAALATMRNLEELRIFLCGGLSDESLTSLASLPKLRALSLPNRDGVTDSQMAYFAQMPALESLSIRSEQITDDGLSKLAGLKSLKKLKLFPYSKATAEGIARLQQAIPGLEIENATRHDRRKEAMSHGQQQDGKVPVAPAGGESPMDTSAITSTGQDRPELPANVQAALTKQLMTATIRNAQDLTDKLSIASGVSFAVQDMPPFEVVSLTDSNTLQFMKEVVAKSGAHVSFIVRPYGILATSVDRARTIPGASIPPNVPYAKTSQASGAVARPALPESVEQALTRPPLTLSGTGTERKLSALVETLGIASGLTFAMDREADLNPYAFTAKSARDIMLAVSDMTRGQVCFVLRDYGVLAASRGMALRLSGASIPEDLPFFQPKKEPPSRSVLPDDVKQLLARTPVSFTLRPEYLRTGGSGELVRMFRASCGLCLRVDSDVSEEWQPVSRPKYAEPFCFMTNGNCLLLMEAIVDASNGVLSFVHNDASGFTLTDFEKARALPGPAIQQTPQPRVSDSPERAEGVLRAPVSENDREDYVEKITRYENRFARCKMVYDSSSYTYDSFVQGALQPSPSPADKVVVTYYAEGHKRRSDSDYYLKHGGHEYWRVVTDGERLTSWQYTNKDPNGQAVLESLGNDNEARFNTREFRPFSGYYQGDATIPLQFFLEGSTVRATWGETERHHYEMTFTLMPWQDMLRPEVVKSVYVDKYKKPEIAYECRYHYEHDPAGNDRVYPSTIEMLSPAHNICGILRIREADFDPSFKEALFRLDSFGPATSITEKTGDPISPRLGAWQKSAPGDQPRPQSGPRASTPSAATVAVFPSGEVANDNGSVAGPQAANMGDFPRYTAELQVFSGPHEIFAAACNALQGAEEVKQVPGAERILSTNDAHGMETLLETLGKDPGLKLLSAPRLTFMSTEDLSELHAATTAKSVKVLTKADDGRSVAWIYPIQEVSGKKGLGNYGDSLVLSLGDGKPLFPSDSAMRDLILLSDSDYRARLRARARQRQDNNTNEFWLFSARDRQHGYTCPRCSYDFDTDKSRQARTGL